MKNISDQAGGTLLLLFTGLLFFTMVMHPAGGDFVHILKHIPMILATHGVSIAALPLGAAGFWCLMRKTGFSPWSVTAFAYVMLSLVATLLAACMNGLVLPIFVSKYGQADPVLIETLQPLLKYNRSVNMAFDYIYSAGFCVGIGCWSTAIWKTRTLPRWTAFLGFGIIALAILQLLLGYAFTSLAGLRLFLVSVIAWVVSAAACMIKSGPDDTPSREK